MHVLVFFGFWNDTIEPKKKNHYKEGEKKQEKPTKGENERIVNQNLIISISQLALLSVMFGRNPLYSVN
jgi:hypothetical protein